MTQGTQDKSGWRISLWVQVVGFLTLALVPLGIMGVLQTSSLREETDQRAQLRLLALTQAAAAGEQEVLLMGLGAAKAMGTIVADLSNDVEACREHMRDFLEGNPRYTFAGFIEPSGRMACSNAAQVYTYSDDEDFISQIASPRLALSLISNPDVSAVPVLNFLSPVSSGDTLLGFMSVSVPATGFPELIERQPGEVQPESLILFNGSGEILTSRLSEALEIPAAPAGIPLQAHIGRGAKTFTAMSGDGVERVFAVIPVVPNVAYAMASWQRGAALLGGGAVQLPAVVVPVIMWIASIAVMSLAMHRLVLRHVLRLRKRMQRFATTRRLSGVREDMVIAAELADLEAEFDRLARTIVQDEAEMENALREKNILLKEVHHRVKNNLQMISSIMNMNLRKATTAETRAAISRLQKRVLNLAQVHRQLYVTDNLAHADAGALLRSIVEPLTEVLPASGRPVDIQLSFDEVHLLPDQLVPLALLTSEIVSNAVKYVGVPDDGRPWLHVDLSFAADPNGGRGRVTLRCANSAGPAPVFSDEEEAMAGLGRQLMRAFALQLGGPLEVQDRAGSYAVTCSFAVSDASDMAGIDF